MASPLLLQHANTVCYVGDFISLPDYLNSDSIPQRNPEHSSFHSSLSDLELVAFSYFSSIIFCMLFVLHVFGLRSDLCLGRIFGMSLLPLRG
jgi:hypothetical protein